MPSSQDPASDGAAGCGADRTETQASRMAVANGKRLGLFGVIGPGLIVAATGVGAGDLATGAFTGNKLGVAVLWVVVLGAFIKFVLNEGLARWQLATGRTVLEGAVQHLGRPVRYIFLAYLLLWSYFVGSALISACGVAAHAMVPVFGDPAHGKIAFGIVHSVLGVVLVLLGGFKLFEKLMAAAIVLMFVTVAATAVLIKPDWAAVGRGIAVPTIPQLAGEGLPWTIALMGGVGGTLTVLCYGYWIREKGRTGAAWLRTCRIDLAVGYGFTAVFGLAMVIIGSHIHVESKRGGANLIVPLARKLAEPLGPAGRWAFLLGAWCAIFSSLLGVWQAVPYVFADFCGLWRRRNADTNVPPVAIDTKSPAYRLYLFAIALVPMIGLLFSFEQVQKAYAIFGALFMAMLAVTLLLLNGRTAWVGRKLRNRRVTTVVLVLVTVLFALAFVLETRRRLGS